MLDATRTANTSTAEHDDWDRHWNAFGGALEVNPANVYRRDLILKLLGAPPAGSVLLDIGSGQGELALDLQRRMPDVEVWGVDYSASGVERSRAAASRHGIRAQFRQVDLLQPVGTKHGQPPASYAVCSEVLEHVDDPARLMRNASALLEPGCRVVVTVPGGPRSAFDHHIGHRRHFTAARLHAVLAEAGYSVDRVLRSGFPAFNIYKLALIARGRRLLTDIDRRTASRAPAPGESLLISLFAAGFRHALDDFPLGWQIAAVATLPGTQPA